MLKTLFVRTAGITAVVCAATQEPAAAQLTFDAQLSPMITSPVFIGHAPSRFAILRQGADPLIIQDGKFKDGTGGGVNAGIRIGERLGLEGMVFWVPTQLEADGGLERYGGEVDVNTLMWGATALFYFPWLGTVEPYVGLGVGAETTSYDPQLAWERHHDLMVNFAIGGSAWLSDRLALRLEARDCFTRFDSRISGIGKSSENDLMMSAGFTFRSRTGR
jgi:hypothetical protein